LSANGDEILSWMIEIWMKKNLLTDGFYNTVKLSSQNNLKRMTNNVGFILSVGDR
jgi:hypothetical protein